MHSYLFAVDLDVSHVIFEHSRHIDLRELVFTEDNEKTSFATGTVANDDQLFTNGRHCSQKYETEIKSKRWKGYLSQQRPSPEPEKDEADW